MTETLKPLDQKKNYRSFYYLLSRIEHSLSKEEWVQKFTNGRTEHLHEMTVVEYNAMIRCLHDIIEGKAKSEEFQRALRKRRSAVLVLMQKYGVDTTDWCAVDSFCKHPRISGKRFCQLSYEELLSVSTRLRVILQKQEQERLKEVCQLHIVKSGANVKE